MRQATNIFLVLILLVITSKLNLYGQVVYQTLLDASSFNAKTINTSLQPNIVNLNPSVSSNGNCVFSLPIQLPTGLNGLNSSASVQYSSGLGNGILGYGCHLNAESIITYDNADLYHDNYTEPADINMGTGGRFALDGQRLISIGGSKYRLEAESFADIKSEGGTPTIPQFFTVIYKNGTIAEYGNGTNNNARVSLTTTSNPIIWKLNCIKDNLGNKIEYVYQSQYFNNNTGVENTLSSIKYTNSSGQVYATVNFNYSTRTDKNHYYVFNTASTPAKIHNTLLLTSINVLSEGLPVRTYEFNYANNGLYSVLQEIKLKGALNAYLNSTWLYYGPVSGSKLYSIQTMEVPDLFEKFYGDFDGDGKQDLFLPYYKFRNDKKMYYRFEVYKINTSTINLNNIFSETETAVLMGSVFLDTVQHNSLGADEKLFADFELNDTDGDLRDDIIFIRRTLDGKVYGMQLYKYNETLSTPNFEIQTGAPYSSSIIYGVTPRNQLQISDFDADNRTDYIYQSGSDVTRITLPALAVNNQPVVNLSTGYDFNSHFKTADSIYVADFNGDGKNDMLIINGLTTYVYSIEKSDAQYGARLLFSTSLISNIDTLAIGDFNGDGKADIWKLPKMNIPFTVFNIYYCSGTGIYNKTFSTGTDYQSGTLKHLSKVVADLNGDGKSDISFITNNAGSTAKYFSNGETFIKSLGGTSYGYADLLGKGYLQGVSFNASTLSIDVSDIRKYANYNFNLVKIKDGFGRVTEFNYKYLTYDPDYTYSNTLGAYPLNEIRPALRVTDKMILPDGIGGTIETRFFYNKMIYHNRGLGGLGFLKTSVLNQVPNVSNLPPVPAPTIISQSFNENSIYVNISSGFFKLLPYRTWNCKSCTDYDNATYKTTVTPQLIELDGSVSRRYFITTNNSESIDELHGYKTVTSNVYDNGGGITNGNITASTIQAYTNGILTSTTSTSFKDDMTAITPSVIPSLFKTTQTTTDRSGDVFTKTITNTYTQQGNVKSTTDNATINTVFSYDYENGTPKYGNVTQIINSDVNGTSGSRLVKYTYTSNGRFLFQIMNDVNDVLIKNENYDARWEQPQKITDFYGKYVDYQYDQNFGWLTSEKASHISSPTTYSKSFSVGTPAGALYKYSITIPDAPDPTAYYDILGRNIKTEEIGVVTKISTSAYNAKGQLTSETIKGANGTDIITGYSSYDDYNRPGITSVSSGSTTQYTYTAGSGTVRVTNTNTGEYKETKTDVTGKLISAKDNNGTLSYSYFGNGSLKSVSLDNNLIQECAIYPATGFQKWLSDKNAGVTSYKYNGFGDVIEQADNCDANGTPNTTSSSIYSITYDQYGRIKTSNLKNPLKSYDVTTTYTYTTSSTSANFKYLLESIADNTTKQEFTYDAVQRPVNIKTTLLTENNYNQTKTISYVLNKNLVDKISYTDLGQTPTVNFFMVKYGYDTHGNITSVNGSSDGGTTLKNIFTTPTYNYFNQVSKYTFGVGTGTKTVSTTYNDFGLLTSTESVGVQKYNYEWDNTSGNLNKRTYTYGATTLVESFGYTDNSKQQLTQISFNGTVNKIDYANNGNILNKYDAGAKPDGSAYVYGEKIHAVTEIKTDNLFISALKTTPQNITYTPFRQPAEVLEGGVDKYTFTYGLDHERIKTVYEAGGTKKQTRYYFGEYEQYTDHVTNKKYNIFYISTPAGMGGIAMKEGSNAFSYYNVYTDHLGSIVTLTDGTGTVCGRQSFDAWGRKRHPDTWAYSSYTQPVNSPFGATGTDGWLNRGYTGHEHLDKADLINMNGRLYDPVVGRMLSADNFVDDPTSTLSYNRYSYVSNNPLKYMDPSGWNKDVFEPVLDIPNPESPKNGSVFGGGPTGFQSMFNMVSEKYGVFAAMAAYNNGYSMGGGMPFFSAFEGRGWSNGEWIAPQRIQIHKITRDNVGLPGEVKNITVGGYYDQIYSAGTYTRNNGMGIDMNNATAGNNAYIPATPHRGFGLPFPAVNIGLPMPRRNDVENSISAIDFSVGLSEMSIGLKLSQPLNIYQKLRSTAPLWSRYSSIINPAFSRFTTLNKVGNVLGKIAVPLSIATTTYSGYKTWSQYKTGGWNNVNKLDVADFGVGFTGLVTTGAVYFGLLSNPVGWAVGGGILIYGGVRLGMDINNDYIDKP